MNPIRIIPKSSHAENRHVFTFHEAAESRRAVFNEAVEAGERSYQVYKLGEADLARHMHSLTRREVQLDTPVAESATIARAPLPEQPVTTAQQDIAAAQNAVRKALGE